MFLIFFIPRSHHFRLCCNSSLAWVYITALDTSFHSLIQVVIAGWIVFRDTASKLRTFGATCRTSVHDTVGEKRRSALSWTRVIDTVACGVVQLIMRLIWFDLIYFSCYFFCALDSCSPWRISARSSCRSWGSSFIDFLKSSEVLSDCKHHLLKGCTQGSSTLRADARRFATSNYSN